MSQIITVIWENCRLKRHDVIVKIKNYSIKVFLVFLLKMKPFSDIKSAFSNFCISKFELLRNILVDVGSEKRQESIPDWKIFQIFGHQQPCRYREKICIYKIKDAYFVCVCVVFPLQGFQYFSLHSDFFQPSMWCCHLFKFSLLKVLHQQEFYEL